MPFGMQPYTSAQIYWFCLCKTVDNIQALFITDSDTMNMLKLSVLSGQMEYYYAFYVISHENITMNIIQTTISQVCILSRWPALLLWRDTRRRWQNAYFTTLWLIFSYWICIPTPPIFLLHPSFLPSLYCSSGRLFNTSIFTAISLGKTKWKCLLRRREGWH